MSASETAKELHQALIGKETKDQELKALNKNISRLENLLNEEMTDEDMDEISFDGIKYKPVTEENFSLTEGGKWDEFPNWFAWLKENGNGDLIKTKEAVHAGTRKSFLKSESENGTILPEWITITHHDTVKYNKTAIKKLAVAE